LAEAAIENELGVALAGLKRLDEAVACFERAAQLDPCQADAQYNWGNALRILERLDEAVAKYRAALAIAPGSPEVHYNLANALRDLGRLKEAVAAYREALRLRPAYLKAANNLGNVLREQGKLEEAAEVYRGALRLRPDYAEGHHNLGVTLSELANVSGTLRVPLAGKGDRHRGGGVSACPGPGSAAEPVRFSDNQHAEQPHTDQRHTECAGYNFRNEAIAHFRAALRINPALLAARNSLGKALTEQGRLDEAASVLRSAQDLGQQSVESQLRLAERLRQAGRYDEAAACIQSVIEAHADLAAAHNNLGLVWASQQDFPRAAACYQEAIRIKPDFAEAQNNLAVALLNAGQRAAGQAAVDAALRTKPDFAVAHLNRAVAWLQAGDFQRGWHEFEWRRLCEPYRVTPLPAPLWDGSRRAGRCVLLHAEQGIGDTLQFVRYAPLVKERCGTVLLQCQQSLVPLLGRSASIDRLLVRGEALPEYHAQAPLMSLPAILGTAPATIPGGVPYISADPELVQAWRGRLAGRAGFKVGISWQGNPKYAADRQRSIPLRHFLPLARLEGVALFSLQRGFGAEQLAALNAEKGTGPICRHGPSGAQHKLDLSPFPVVDFGPDFDTAAGAFMDTAAVMRNLDLVVTSDTAIAHLAGAMGVPVWVALGSFADWRWLDDREDSPWYPTMRLFRQRRPGDWPGVFEAVAAELARVVAGDASRLAAPPPASGCPATAPLLRAVVSAGDLLDRISILEIKRARITDPAAAQNVARELEELLAIRGRDLPRTAELQAASVELRALNERLWETEDQVRRCEACKDFGPRFVELARSVYRTNDDRSSLKRRVNAWSHSPIIEEKLYAANGGDSSRAGGAPAPAVLMTEPHSRPR
jgi:tetratricopeptide (TPR) repeat protein